MVETLTRGFLSGTPCLSFASRAVVYGSRPFQFPSRTAFKIAYFYFNGVLRRNRSSTVAITEEISSLNEVAAGAEIGRTTASYELFARLSHVLDNLSMSRPTHTTPDIGCRPIRHSTIAYNKLMKSFAEVGKIDEVLRLAWEMKQSNCNPNVYCYNTVMNALVEANRPAEAEGLFKEMIADGVAPNVSSYNVLVKLYSFCLKEFDSAYDVIAMMVENGCNPDSTTYSTLITGLCREGRVEEARGCLGWMLEEKCLVDAYTYTPIVQGYCSRRKIEEAKQLIVDMGSLGLSPNCVTYNILVGALCKSGRFEEVERIFRESSTKCWKPDEITFNTYIDGLCKQGRVKDAYDKLEMMLENGIHPGKVTLNILLDCLCHELRFSEAICLLARSPELEWHPGIVGYNTVMSRLCKDGKWSTVLKLLVDILKKGIAHNTKTLNIVIDSLCRAGKVRQAKCFIDNQGFIADVATYNTVIHWLFQLGKMNEAFHMFCDMNTKKITPDLITHTIMVHGLCKGQKYLEATEYFLRYLNGEFALDVYVCLISKLLHHTRYKEILYLFDGLESQSQFLSSIVFCSTISTFCKKGYCDNTKMYGVCLILDKMLCLVSIKKFRRS